MLKKRVITSLWFACLISAVVWFGGESGFAVLMAVFGILAALEFYRMVEKVKPPPFTYFGLVWTALLILSRNSELLSLRVSFLSSGLIIPLLLTSAVVIPLIGILVRQQKDEDFSSWVWTVAGILYVGWLLGHLVALRGMEDGRNWVFFILFVTWVSDTFAYFVGKRLGRHLLAPGISPGKTWEGTAGGLGAAVAMGIVFFTPTPFQLPMGYGQLILLAILVSVCGQLGDLVESLLKRNMGAKDSGSMMPGHGGVLDRFDSLILSAPVLYYVIYYCLT